MTHCFGLKRDAYYKYKSRADKRLKIEFYLDPPIAIGIDSLQHAKRATKNAINLYNEIRLHLTLEYKTPNMVYLKTA